MQRGGLYGIQGGSQAAFLEGGEMRVAPKARVVAAIKPDTGVDDVRNDMGVCDRVAEATTPRLAVHRPVFYLPDDVLDPLADRIELAVKFVVGRCKTAWNSTNDVFGEHMGASFVSSVAEAPFVLEVGVVLEGLLIPDALVCPDTQVGEAGSRPVHVLLVLVF